MKKLIFFSILTTLSFAGFFNETVAKDKAEFMENERLCKIFTKKVEVYKKTMRDDFLATTTLNSYQYRASLFCNKAKELKKNIFNDTNTTDTNESH